MSNGWPSDRMEGIGSWEERNSHLFRDIPDELKVDEGPRRRSTYVEGVRYTENDLRILTYLGSNGEATPSKINNAIGNGTKEWCKHSLNKLLKKGKVKRTDKGVYSLA